MKFTFWAIGAPFLIIGFCKLVVTPGDVSGLLLTVLVVAGFWFWIGLACVGPYWLVRLVRYAWYDKRAPAPGAAALPSSEPDSGRIFGRLN